MPAPRGNLVTIALETITKGIRSAWGSDADRLGVAPFPSDFHDDTNYTQIVKNGSAVNQTTVIHTVTSGKSLFLHHIYVAVSNHGGAAYNHQIQITDASNNVQYAWKQSVQTGGQFMLSMEFDIPIKIPAGYKIRLISSALSAFSEATIYGYEK